MTCAEKKRVGDVADVEIIYAPVFPTGVIL